MWSHLLSLLLLLHILSPFKKNVVQLRLRGPGLEAWLWTESRVFNPGPCTARRPRRRRHRSLRRRPLNEALVDVAVEHVAVGVATHRRRDFHWPRKIASHKHMPAWTSRAPCHFSSGGGAWPASRRHNPPLPRLWGVPLESSRSAKQRLARAYLRPWRRSHSVTCRSHWRRGATVAHRESRTVLVHGSRLS